MLRRERRGIHSPPNTFSQQHANLVVKATTPRCTSVHRPSRPRASDSIDPSRLGMLVTKSCVVDRASGEQVEGLHRMCCYRPAVRTPGFLPGNPGSNPGSNPRVRAVDVRGRRVPSLAGETPTQREDRSTAVRPKHLGQGELKSSPWDASERGLSSSTTGSTCAARLRPSARKPGPAMAK